MLAVVFTVALAGIGVSQASDGGLVPASCDATVADNGAAVTITWTGGGDWVSIVRNGEPIVTVSVQDNGRTFTDIYAPAGNVTYEVSRGNFNGTNAATQECGTVAIATVQPLEPVTSCDVSLATENGQAEIGLVWDSAAGASEYIVWNNGRQIHTTTGTSYTVPGTYDGAKTQHFAVSSKAGNNKTFKHYCGMITPDDVEGGVDPVHTCGVEALRDGTVEITFSHPFQVKIWRNGVEWARPFGDEMQGRIVDTRPLTGSATYTLRELDEIGREAGETLTCGTVVAGGSASIQPVTECSVRVLVDYEVRLEWLASPGATDYVVWNNGRQTFDSEGRTWKEINFGGGVGSTQHFAVSSKTDAGLAPKTYCGAIAPDDLNGTPDQPSCTVYIEESTETFDVRWTGLGDGEAVVQRTVDGSPWYWRGRSPTGTFRDTYRPGDVRYQVAHRNVDGTLNAAVVCSER